jgi:hypothetical protein
MTNAYKLPHPGYERRLWTRRDDHRRCIDPLDQEGRVRTAASRGSTWARNHHGPLQSGAV